MKLRGAHARKARCAGMATVLALCVPAWRPASADLLSDPRYKVGAKLRMDQFVRRGADPKEADAIFHRLTDLEPERWVAEWTRLAEPWERQAADLETQGKGVLARDAHLKASAYYSIAKFPVLDHPAKQAAYRKCVETYMKAARYFDPPLERVAIPFEGKRIIGYLRLPKGVTAPPVVIATGGVDVYKEDREVSDLLDAGFAAFSMDMPGAGESPLWYTPDADRLYSATIDYLLSRKDIDAQRLGIIGRSYGGYWGAKMAYVEPRRIKAAVQWGGPIHYTFQEPWIRQVQQDRTYLWSLLDSMIYASHLKDLDELISYGPTLSLKTQGWLDKPSAPLLGVNGEKDPWISVQDVYVLFQTGEPKAVRTYPDGGHMGRDAGPSAGPAAGVLVMSWLKSHLAK